MSDDQKSRKIIQDRISKGMIGPGSDIWGLPDEDEIISSYPLLRYFSGVVFPEKTDCATFSEQEDAEANSEGPIDSVDIGEDEKVLIDSESALTNAPELKNISDDGLQFSQSNFYSNNIGLSFALKKEVTSIDVTFSFGVYFQPKQIDVKIKIPEDGFRSFFDEGIPIQLDFKSALKHDEDGYMYLERPLKGSESGPDRANGEYGAFDLFKNKSNLKKQGEAEEYFLAYYYIQYLELLLGGRIWKRKQISVHLPIPLSITGLQELELGDDVPTSIVVGYYLQVYTQKNCNYVKIQLVNLSEKHPANRFSNKSEALNKKCIFQAKISIYSEGVSEYKDTATTTYFIDEDLKDEEAEEIELAYRSVKSFGIGHKCSVKWSPDHKAVETTFTPEYDIKDVINEFKDNDHNECLNIKNLSVWGLSKVEILERLKLFVNDYETWIKGQIALKSDLSEKETKVAQRLIDRQNGNLNRLKKNLELLQDEKIFRAFQIANTAMFIQLIVANDIDFGKTEKEIFEIAQQIEFDKIRFFENFDSEKRLGFSIKYRPFQLAFLILSLEEIVKPETRNINNTVDLIWFPTGGGKTEAYLAVAAFAIIFRRVNNQEGYDGTSVIMRYTLRLLTAQQFERASKLILALEFLRNQTEFSKELKSEPITIGLWVGMSSTPNTLLEVKKVLKNINAEADKGEKGDPHRHNMFQISSCPWCGAKIISKDTNSTGGSIWRIGFKEKKSDFIIFCQNNRCFFHKQLPIQVVDECLYTRPPTLLFGTVDKFAILAWREDSFNFFNTQSDTSLPPDLVIQDELHLLSGPLGSVTAFFESVLEMLCTKKNIAPKIIASTATTRNTKLQIQKLYGNRNVNIFPPLGINFNDSYFSKESDEESKRRYIGIMPTGKTPIDTQLQLLAHVLVARLEVFVNSETKDKTDLYWTIVSYYNSLKDVGKIYNKVGDEIKNFTSTLQHSLALIYPQFKQLAFNYVGIPNRTAELTSRIESTKIKSVLKEIEKAFLESNLKGDYSYLTDVVDFVLATNMISVGIDISRLNVMVLNGMPKNVAEYIQASSRIGRKNKGLAITLFDANRAREKSYFEHFVNFHQAFYKCVEPLSVTPFTENTIDKMLTTAFVAFVRNKMPELAKDSGAKNFLTEHGDEFKMFLTKRFSEDSETLEYFNMKLDGLIKDWEKRVNLSERLSYKTLLKKPTEREEGEIDWTTMQSMREIDTNTFIEIKQVY